MSKKFLTYDEQLKRLSEHKRVVINDERGAIKVLEKYSYYNFINSTKICFAKGKNSNGHHIYDESSFDDWVERYEKTIEIINYINGKILEIETHLNSLISYCISNDYIKNKCFNQANQSYYSICENLCSENERRDSRFPNHNILKDMDGNEFSKEVLSNSWKYVPHFTYGEILKVFNKLGNEIQNELCDKLGYSKQQLQTLAYIRNDLFHHKPLMITMQPSNTRERGPRIKVLRKIAKNSAIEEDVEVFIECILKYVEVV